MSKQPNAPAAVPLRTSRPVGWVRDLPIWTKLGLIMIVPTLATIIVGTAGLLDHVQAANNADRARTLVVLAGDAGNLVHGIQDERSKAVQLLNTSQKADLATLTGEYANLQEKTDAANLIYRQSRSTLADIPDNLRALLDRIEAQLGELPKMRTQIVGRIQIPRSVAERRYRVLISDLLQIRDIASQFTGDTTLTERLRAAGAVASVKEYLSQERVVVLQTLADKEMTEANRREFINTRTGQDLALTTFAGAATPDQSQLLNRTITGPEVRQTLEDEGRLDSLAIGANPNTVVNADTWDRSMSGRSDLLNTVETALNAQAQTAAVDLGARVQRQVLLETGLLLLTLLLGVLFAWLVARSMARSLRDLRQGALAVAQYGLPQAVARLRDPALATNMSPAGVALQIAEPLPVRSRDEFGQVTEAFNAVHLEAVRTAAEQAALRSSVATMFVNLARRSQILVDRLIGHLDRLERGEQDPDRLSELFQLDHLATRMRRNDENLLVLAGADSTRIQREPAALMDVLRAAQSEVEHYTRIEFGTIDQDIEIAAHAVNDLVHLVAELFDNATAFSPPDTAITVEARRVGDRAVLQVEDRGIGMSPDQYAELNDRLATPPMVDVAVSRMMGLVVVARLAARHGVKTELRPAPDRGTVADVLMPSGVLVPRALAGRGQMPTGFPAAARPAPVQAPPRPSFGAPLALESGPSGPPPTWGSPAPGVPAPTWGNGQPAWGTPEQPAWGNGQPAPAWGANGTPGGAPAWGAPDAPPDRRVPWPARDDVRGPARPPAGQGPPSFAAGGLGAALAGERGFDPANHPGRAGNGTNGSHGRALPAWSDLTGSDQTDQHHQQPSGPGGPSENDPLPQRRPQWGEAEGSDPGLGIPRQPSGPAEGRPGFAASGPAGSRPPAWPPVSTEAGGYPDAVPSVPEAFSASLDMTSELPKMRDADTSEPMRYSNDMTMELPIFRELESAWFHTEAQESAAGSAGWSEHAAGGDWSTDPALAASAMSGRRSARAGGEDASGSASEVSWRTAADDGWMAAQAATEPHDGGNTDMGLPRRVPMAQLVPGGVESATGGSDRRTPDSVRGLLSAYHRGVQRGRDAHAGAADEATDSQSSGKEQDA